MGGAGRGKEVRVNINPGAERDFNTAGLYGWEQTRDRAVHAGGRWTVAEGRRFS